MVKRAKANQTKKKPSYTEAATAEKSEKETGGESERARDGWKKVVRIYV